MQQHRLRPMWHAAAPLVLTVGLLVGALACNRDQASTSPDEGAGANEGARANEAAAPDEDASPTRSASDQSRPMVGGLPGHAPSVPGGIDPKWALSPREQQRVEAIQDREMAILQRDPAFEAYLLRGLEPGITPEEAYVRGSGSPPAIGPELATSAAPRRTRGRRPPGAGAPRAPQSAPRAASGSTAPR